MTILQVRAIYQYTYSYSVSFKTFFFLFDDTKGQEISEGNFSKQTIEKCPYFLPQRLKMVK